MPPPRICERTRNGETELLRQARAQGDIGAASGSAIVVKQLVAADRFDRIGRAGHQMIGRMRIALAPEKLRVGPEADALSVPIDLDMPLMGKLVLAEDQVSED